MESPLPPRTTSTDEPLSDGPRDLQRPTSPLLEPPIRLVCVGAHLTLAIKLLEQLKPHYTYCAILTTVEPKQIYSLENLDLVLDALYPPPAGVIVGGGFSDEEGEEIARIVETKNRERQMSMEFVKVPTRTLESVGPEGLLRKIKELLYEKFTR